MFDQNTYSEDIKHFTQISTTKAKQLLASEDLTVIYIGRETCPFCRKFAKKLNNLAPQIQTTIYYIDSSNPSDDEIASFREQYHIATIPGFMVRKNGNLTVLCDSSIPENELLDMIH